MTLRIDINGNVMEKTREATAIEHQAVLEYVLHLSLYFDKVSGYLREIQSAYKFYCTIVSSTYLSGDKHEFFWQNLKMDSICPTFWMITSTDLKKTTKKRHWTEMLRKFSHTALLNQLFVTQIVVLTTTALMWRQIYNVYSLHRLIFAEKNYKTKILQPEKACTNQDFPKLKLSRYTKPQKEQVWLETE